MRLNDKGAGGNSQPRLCAHVGIALLAVLLAACAAGTPSAPQSASASRPSATSSSAVVGSQATAPASDSPSAVASTAPRATATPEPSPVFPTTGVTIVYEEQSQFELWSPKGVRVFVDIVEPSLITSPPTSADVVLTTHFHPDHFRQGFLDAFPGKALTVEEGTLTAGDVKIRAIAAAHNQGDPLVPKGGTDYIFIIDIGGIRVVVFGDLGQDKLTASQMQAIGTVDVAISQLENSVSDVTAANRKAIAQMDQVKPALLLPTHIDTLDGARMAASAWATATAGRWVTITRDRLPQALTVLFMGDLAPSYRKILGITTPVWR